MNLPWMRVREPLSLIDINISNRFPITLQVIKYFIYLLLGCVLSSIHWLQLGYCLPANPVLINVRNKTLPFRYCVPVKAIERREIRCVGPTGPWPARGRFFPSKGKPWCKHTPKYCISVSCIATSHTSFFRCTTSSLIFRRFICPPFSSRADSLWSWKSTTSQLLFLIAPRNFLIFSINRLLRFSFSAASLSSLWSFWNSNSKSLSIPIYQLQSANFQGEKSSWHFKRMTFLPDCDTGTAQIILFQKSWFCSKFTPSLERIISEAFEWQIYLEAFRTTCVEVLFV